jgi:hypothetical protein
MTIEGTIVKLMAKQNGTSKSGNTWERNDFVISTEGDHSKKIYITAYASDKLQIVNNLKVGEKVKVSFNLESRENNDKWYTSVNAWKVEKI